MGDFSVKAVLSAVDKNFSSTMKNAMGATSNLKSSLTSGLGFGVLMGIGQQAFTSLSRGVSGLMTEMNSASAAWKTFEGNMTMNGKTASEIKAIKEELQSFAELTIYSSSDMASTFSQLEAVGTKNTTKLVKGFGGLAASAEKPQQAMKTLSQQATQMAAKPTVAWMDFKLMLEQTPAGISAVAKEMGMSTSELVRNVQDGTVATEDFFDAVTKVGTNDSFTKLATEYKTAGQAMDGLKETVSNKLAPAFDVLSGTAISAISSIVDSTSALDGEAIAGKLSSFLGNASKYWQVFKEDVSEVKSAFGDAVSAIVSEVGNLTGAFGSTESIDSFADVLDIAKGALVTFAGFLEEHADIIAKVISVLPQLLLAYAGFKILTSIAPIVGTFSKGILMLAGNGVSAIVGKLFGISKGQEAVGKSSGNSSKKMLASAKSLMMLGAGVALVSVGFALLSYSAISLAQAGPLAIGVMAGMVVAVAAIGAGMTVMLNSIKPGPAKLQAISVAMLAMGVAVVLVAAGFAILTASAISLASAGPLVIAVMVGMVAAIAGLALGASILGPALTAGAVGFVAFGAAIALVGVGALLAATALMLVSGVLPVIVQYGLSGALAIAQLALGMTAFAAGAALAGAGCIVLGAGLAVVAVGLVLVGAAVAIAAVGVLALAGGVVLLGVGMMATAMSLSLAAATLPMLASGAATSTAALAAMLAISLALTASLALLAVPLLLLSTTFLLATVGVAGFSLAMTVGAVGVLAMSLALKAVNSSMKSIANNAKAAQSSITSMVSAVDIINAGLDALGGKAKSAVNKLVGAFSNGAGKAKSSGKSLGDGVRIGVQTGLVPLPAVATLAMTGFNTALRSGGNTAAATARSMSNSIVASMRSASSGSYSSGYNIGIGLANGMRACLGTVRSAAAQLASAAESAIRAKAQIHSPSRISTKLGNFWGGGLAGGIKDKAKEVWKQAEKLVRIPSIMSARTPEVSLAGGGNMRLSEEYTYSNNATYTIIVPVELEGREVARVTAPFTEDELKNIQRKKRRLNGIR